MQPRSARTGGFALLAFPAEFGNSGVMSILMNHDSAVLQNDLGDQTTGVAKAINEFDPVDSRKAME
jgi:hypothetical protein